MTQPGFLSPEKPDRHVHDTHAPHLLFSDTHSSVPRGPLGSGEESDLVENGPRKGMGTFSDDQDGKTACGAVGCQL